mmetsp:Transcript_68783/g.199189  ORF Transcript_68783/g.199189 Transcript_68783/m.199189 type:complete len:210 (-) Transcript_68783:833-1462(-)
MMPMAYRAPPSEYGLPRCPPPDGRYVLRTDRDSLMWPLWITPRDAVALNFAQLVALASHSKFFRKKTTLVVPHCMSPCAMTVALCVMEFFGSREFLMISKSNRSERLFRCRNSRCKSMDDRPERILRSCPRCSLPSSDSSPNSSASFAAAASTCIASAAGGDAAASAAPSAGASAAGAGAGGSLGFSSGDLRSTLQKCWFSLSTASKAT